MTERAYRFLPAMEPDAYAVFHAETMTRVPGIVKREADGRVTFVRERYVAGAKVKDTLTADKVVDLSALVEKYFTSGANHDASGGNEARQRTAEADRQMPGGDGQAEVQPEPTGAGVAGADQGDHPPATRRRRRADRSAADRA